MRTLVTIHLPIEMGLAVRIMRAVADEYPDAKVESHGTEMRLVADEPLFTGSHSVALWPKEGDNT